MFNRKTGEAMLNKKTYCTIVVSFFVMCCAAICAQAQADESKMEVGVQFAALRNGLGYWYDIASSMGGGGRLTFNLNQNIALEGEVNYFPNTGYYDVSRWQGQFGVKSGVRLKQVGFFGKLRPGFMRASFDVPIYCIQAPCPPMRQRHTGFSLDVGGVVEFYPARRMTVRFDLGDTIVHRRLAGAVFPVNPLALPVNRLSIWALPKETTHNLQINAGIGFRF
jgi:hypothetical protein